ncbi:MAG: ABC transporter substrate-binding protein [Cetobacterium sp.]
MKNIRKKLILLFCSGLLFGCNKEKIEEVNIYMWGGAKEINVFMDDIVAPEVLKKDEIKLKRVPIMDVKDIVNKLVIEKKAQKKNGVVDILWVNGENFKLLKDTDVLEKDILSRIKNKDIIKESTKVKDFGEPIDGLEIPFGEAQFNFIYDSKKEKIPFHDYKSLKTYVINNPGKFTYPSISNFTGSAFVRNIAIDILGYENIENISNEGLEKKLKIVWDYFNELKPYLWRKGETYPESESKLDLLYSIGEIDFTMGYTINKVNSKIETKEFPETSKSFLLDKGTLFNNHYLVIPKNAKNKEKALDVINRLVSPEIQSLKQDSKHWGDFTVLDMGKLEPEVAEKFISLNKAEKIPSIKELEEKRIMELKSDKLRIIEKGWIENVEKK